MAKLVAKTYGDALFALAQEKNLLDTYYEEVLAVAQALQDNNELAELMNHPKIVKEEKIKLIEEIFQNLVSADITGFLVVIVTKDRFGEVLDILSYFVSLVKEFKRIGDAYVTTAVELSRDQQKRVEDKLLATTSYQSLDMHYQVDPALIGGLTIRIGDRVVDSSIRTKLTDLGNQLLKIQLA